MADINRLYDALRKADAAGDTESAQKLAAYIRQQQVVEPAAEAQDPNFMQRVGPAIAERVTRSGEAIGRTGQLIPFVGENKQSLPETGLQLAGEGIMGASDVLGNLLVSGFGALGSLPTGFGGEGTLAQNIPGEIDRIMPESVRRGIDGVGGAIGGLVNRFEQLEEERPRTAANLRSLGAIATLASPQKVMGSLGSAGRYGGQATKNLGKTIKNMIPEPKAVRADMIAEQSSKAFDLADRVGGAVKGSKIQDLRDVIYKIPDEKGATLPAEARVAVQKLSDPEKAVRQALDVFDGLGDEDLTLDGFIAIDQALGDIAYAQSTSATAARQIQKMQRELRGFAENAGPDDMVGGAEGFEVYAKARDLWSKSSRMRELEGITTRAFTGNQNTDNLKRALQRWLANDKNTRGFSDLEIDAIRKASETGTLGEMGRALGSRLIDRIAFGSGNPALGVGANIASNITRSARDNMMLKQMQKINNMIAAGKLQKESTLGSLMRATGGAVETTGKVLENAYGPRGAKLGTLGVVNQQLQQEE